MPDPAPDGWGFSQTRVLMPSFAEDDLEWLKRNEPFAIQGSLQAGAQFLELVEIPTILTMMGVAGPPGLFGYAYLVDPDSTELEQHLFLSTVVGHRVCLPLPFQAETVSWRVLGIHPSAGALCTHIAFQGPGLAPFIEEFREAGTRIIAAKDYEVPKAVLSQVMARRGGQ